MLKFRRFVSISVFVVSLSIAAASQTAPAKSVLINTSAFYDEKAGIVKLVSAEKQINIPFAKDIKELQDGNAKLRQSPRSWRKRP